MHMLPCKHMIMPLPECLCSLRQLTSHCCRPRLVQKCEMLCHALTHLRNLASEPVLCIAQDARLRVVVALPRELARGRVAQPHVDARHGIGDVLASGLRSQCTAWRAGFSGSNGPCTLLLEAAGAPA